jgi:uncharacterized membrane protein YhaH (DUF805 family)
MGLTFQKTFDIKGKTPLEDANLALLFQLALVSIIVIFVSSSKVIDYGIGITIVGHILLSYVLLSSLSFTTLVVRRLHDIEVNPTMIVVGIWISYILVGLFRYIDLFHDVLDIFLPLMVYFLVHFFTIMMLMMPTKEE